MTYPYTTRRLEKRLNKLINRIDLAERVLKRADDLNRPNHEKTLSMYLDEKTELVEILTILNLSNEIERPFKSLPKHVKVKEPREIHRKVKEVKEVLKEVKSLKFLDTEPENLHSKLQTPNSKL
jgi:hypothetical protein